MTALISRTLFLLSASLALAPAFAAAQSCPSSIVAMPKSSSLYLYYPTTADATFPSYGGAPTSPLNPFNMADLDPSVGTAAQMQQRVEQLTEAGYCEFDVDVRTRTTTPSSSEPRWQIVGIGTDATGTGLIGKAQAVDTNDADAQDYARFWVEELQGWAGAELTGANSTLERWSTALANLVVHESGHNYGGTHNGGVALAGEDATVNHFMTNPALGANPDSIVDGFNHFSDTNYEILAHNIGLTAKTLTNWDFVNPNAGNADRLVITVLSNAPALTIGWWYNGSLSPWRDPTVADTGGTTTFRGVTYKRYEVTFSTAKSWTGGAAGIAPPAVKFHVGASFTQPDPTIIYEARLFNGSTELGLHPRMFDFDLGSSFDGFMATIINPNPDAGFLVLSNLRILFAPRMIDIETMIDAAAPIGLNGLPVETYRRQGRALRGEISGADDLARRQFEIGEKPLRLPIASFADKRHVDIVYTAKDCLDKQSIRTLDRQRLKKKPVERVIDENGAAFGPPGTADYCPKGNQLSLFPATYVYLSATLTDPAAKQWDPAVGEFVEKPLSTRVFFQAAGVVPDANRNGVDDLLDIRMRKSRDKNKNGIPDETERRLKGREDGAYPVLERERFEAEKSRYEPNLKEMLKRE